MNYIPPKTIQDIKAAIKNEGCLFLSDPICKNFGYTDEDDFYVLDKILHSHGLKMLHIHCKHCKNEKGTSIIIKHER